jgi:enolase-phosphatase E1
MSIDSNLTSRGIRAILLDIEGTTTPVAFVHDVMFSYARTHVRAFLSANLASPDTVADVADLQKEHTADVDLGHDPPPLNSADIDSLTTYIHWLIDRDRKSSPLKSLQGRIWKEGFLDGTLKAEVYEDVSPAMLRWRQAGLTINIFSSGSKLAQKLLFAHTEAGDLTEFIDKYFDTTTGPKTEAESYRRIAIELGLPVREVIFISDIVAELDAARSAGMQTRLCIRPGWENQENAEDHHTVGNFDEIV